MEIATTFPIPDAAVIAIDGEMDLYNANQLREAFQQALTDSRRGIVLELSRLRYLDSSGVGVLIHMIQSLKSRKGRLAVVGLHGSPEKVLTMTNIIALLKRFSTCEEAVAYITE
ncbi:STAS domain-containing protein [Spirochaeta africana]|uniref:Anti-sigma factor antagonist n=1 Tax=Spirochaeta africana (strain ATCC 700263 / DSM 8902 / Z-7692) TaxID=889378 RepID=H9UID4_SPIAZ|nr:STAS domain-containing protein [Spirochaeta africana]AFG37277.1 anti-anti-sigma factor [Spirochaeta africana DSM 8902]